MDESKSVVPLGKIENRILLIKGEKVIIDANLAEFYGVPTKRLNEQVKWNTNNRVEVTARNLRISRKSLWFTK